MIKNLNNISLIELFLNTQSNAIITAHTPLCSGEFQLLEKVESFMTDKILSLLSNFYHKNIVMSGGVGGVGGAMPPITNVIISSW